MKNKIFLILVFLFIFSSCSLLTKNENVKSLSGSLEKNNIIDEKDGLITKKEIVVENKLKNIDIVLNSKNQNEQKSNNDEENYLKFQKLHIDKMLTYDCNNFKINDFIQKCIRMKSVMKTVNNNTKNNQSFGNKIKMMKEGDLSICEEYLKTKDEEGYFNCSLAVVIGNTKGKKCNDIKNVENFSKYFGKTCDEMILNINKYIDLEVSKQSYEQMLNGFWSQEEKNNLNNNISDIYINEIIKNSKENELKESTVKTN